MAPRAAALGIQDLLAEVHRQVVEVAHLFAM